MEPKSADLSILAKAVLEQSDEFIAAYILKRLGIKCAVMFHHKKLFIICGHWENCFEIVRKLEITNYSVHKDSTTSRYTLEIKK